METSKTYFFSSSCLCVSGVSGRAVGGEENDFFLKYGRHRLRRRRGRNCGPPRKIILHVPQALDPEKNTSVSPTGATPPPTSGLFIQSVVVVGFQEEKSGKGKRRGRRGRGQPNVEVEEEGTERHIFSTLNCHAIRRFVFVPFAPGGSPAANASAGGVARNSDKARKQRATCRTTECRRHVVSQLFRRIGVVIVQLSTPVLLPVARAELQIESFANMSAFSGNTAVLPIAKTAQLALVFVKEKNKGRVF